MPGKKRSTAAVEKLRKQLLAEGKSPDGRRNGSTDSPGVEMGVRGVENGKRGRGSSKATGKRKASQNLDTASEESEEENFRPIASQDTPLSEEEIQDKNEKFEEEMDDMKEDEREENDESFDPDEPEGPCIITPVSGKKKGTWTEHELNITPLSGKKKGKQRSRRQNQLFPVDPKTGRNSAGQLALAFSKAISAPGSSIGFIEHDLNMNWTLLMSLNMNWAWIEHELNMNWTWIEHELNMNCELNMNWTWIEHELNTNWTWIGRSRWEYIWWLHRRTRHTHSGYSDRPRR